MIFRLENKSQLVINKFKRDIKDECPIRTYEFTFL